jgi:hypothetical protein
MRDERAEGADTRIGPHSRVPNREKVGWRARRSAEAFRPGPYGHQAVPYLMRGLSSE